MSRSDRGGRPDAETPNTHTETGVTTMSRELTVALVGATGVVGAEFLSCMEERDFPVAELRLLATKRSEGRELTFRGQTHIVHETTTTPSTAPTSPSSPPPPPPRANSARSQPSAAQSPSTTPPPSASRRACRWLCPRSIPKTCGPLRDHLDPQLHHRAAGADPAPLIQGTHADPRDRRHLPGHLRLGQGRSRRTPAPERRPGWRRAGLRRPDFGVPQADRQQRPPPGRRLPR